MEIVAPLSMLGKISKGSIFKQWVKSRIAKAMAMGSELERYLRLEL